MFFCARSLGRSGGDWSESGGNSGCDDHCTVVFVTQFPPFGASKNTHLPIILLHASHEVVMRPTTCLCVALLSTYIVQITMPSASHVFAMHPHTPGRSALLETYIGHPPAALSPPSRHQTHKAIPPWGTSEPYAILRMGYALPMLLLYAQTLLFATRAIVCIALVSVKVRSLPKKHSKDYSGSLAPVT